MYTDPWGEVPLEEAIERVHADVEDDVGPALRFENGEPDRPPMEPQPHTVVVEEALPLASEAWPSVVRGAVSLSLVSCGLGGLSHPFVAAPFLRRLDLSCNNLLLGQVAALESALLLSLNLSYNDLGNSGGNLSLASALGGVSGLRILSLTGCGCGPGSLNGVGKSLPLLTSLSVDENHIGSLDELLEGCPPTLRTLETAGNPVEEETPAHQYKAALKAALPALQRLDGASTVMEAATGAGAVVLHAADTGVSDALLAGTTDAEAAMAFSGSGDATVVA